MALASIRTRLTAGYALVLMFTLLGLGVTVYLLLAGALAKRIDMMLDFELQEAAERLAAGWPAEELAREPAAFHETYFLRILDDDGLILAQSRKLVDHSLPLADARWAGERPLHASATLGALGSCRLVTGQVRVGNERRIVQIATSIGGLERDLADLKGVLWTILPAGLLAATAGGYWMAGRSLDPVRRMTEAARRISAANLGERLGVSNPGDELGQLATTLNAMLDRIDLAFAANRRFTADAAHELKTPVASIRAEAEVSLLAGRPAEEYAETLRSIVEEAERLTRLTDRLLLLSREDAGASNPCRAIRLDEVVQRASARAGDAALRAGLTLRVENLPRMEMVGDPELLPYVFDKLMENAVQYTPPGGIVTVRGSCSDGWAVVEISDTGIGIPEEAMPHVFDRFFRVDPSRSRRTGGTGLGLSIARAVAERHAGAIEVESTLGEGSTFRVLLPMGQAGNRVRAASSIRES